MRTAPGAGWLGAQPGLEHGSRSWAGLELDQLSGPSSPDQAGIPWFRVSVESPAVCVIEQTFHELMELAACRCSEAVLI